MKHVLLSTIVCFASAVAAQETDVCTPNDDNLYTQACIDQLKARTLQIALMQAERTCAQVKAALILSPYTAEHEGSIADGTRCTIRRLETVAIGLPALSSPTGQQREPLPRVGGNSQGMETDPFAIIQRLAETLAVDDFSTVGGSGEAIVVTEDSFWRDQGITFDPTHLQDYSVEATNDDFIMLRDETTRFVIDADTGTILNSAPLQGQ